MMGENPLLSNLVMEACQEDGWVVRPGDKELVVVVPVREDRQQEVVIALSEDDTESVARFHTVIGPVKDLTGTRPLAALRLNFALASGAFAIHGDNLVLCRLHPLKDLDSGEARSTIGYLAETGDRYEEHLYGTDVH